MIRTLITSQTRIKLLKKFFLNSGIKAHLRGLEAEFGDSTNAIRVELNRFEKAGLLVSFLDSNKKVYQANCRHPLFSDIHNIILKETKLDKVIEKVIYRVGNLHCVYLTGEFAHGRNCNKIELIFVGENIDREYLERKVNQASKLAGREISYMIVDPAGAERTIKLYDPGDLLPLWNCSETGLKHKKPE